MNQNNIHDNNYWRNMLTRSALVLITVVIIVWFMPRTQGEKFHYEIDKPWSYKTLYSEYEFPIYKSKEALEHEKDSVMKFFQPYYNYKASVEKQQLNKFLQAFANGIPGTPANTRSVIADRLHRLYQAGIMNTPEYGEFASDSTRMIRLVKGKEAQSTLVNCIFSTRSAYEALLNDKSLTAYRIELNRCNLDEYIEPNVVYDKNKSETESNELISGIAAADGVVKTNEKIIDRGEKVSAYKARVLDSYIQETERRTSMSNAITTTILGQTIFVFILITLFTCYLSLFRRDYFEKPRSIAMLYAMVTLFPILVSLMIGHIFFSIYILPFAMVPIFIRVFTDSRTAFIAHTTMVLTCAVVVKNPYEFIIVQLVAGLVAIYSLRELTKRSQLFKTAILVALASSAVYLALQLIQNNSVLDIDRDIHSYFAYNGILLLLAYPLMYLIEKTFGFISDVTLFELSNTNKGLLRDLSEVAPGTFQHSITVGNLAAEIANRIEANSLLVRTGALYHDIGKMTNPVFFTENQAGHNPHNNMPYQESARIVISHVTEGVHIAEKNNLPNIIKEFILTHHGKGLTRYFYIKYQNEHPDEIVDKTPFSYPGPNPFTREQAILMMADAVEAASRSLNEYTEESISQLVNRIIDGQVAEGYFSTCPITFHDIDQAKQVLIERLKSIYHTRVSYPTLKKE